MALTDLMKPSPNSRLMRCDAPGQIQRRATSVLLQEAQQGTVYLIEFIHLRFTLSSDKKRDNHA